ncbi:MAG: GAF domain-containing sensor histidine kinase [Chitinophagaceae bacterium]|nr:MAG: GAF domain-containing sensor histidine kinase [Chitinophagaceae bacterium]
MSTLNKFEIDRDILLIGRIPVISKILKVVCDTTGMGFAAVARVTDEQWVACAVRDEINFGLAPGGELKLETTICHEIRQTGDPVIINEVNTDPTFASHHTPAMYGFQSYISIPIVLGDGSFFGTLCAIDPKPKILSTPGNIGMFQVFAELIATHLDALISHEKVAEQLVEEKRIAQLREEFIAILGHDLRTPINATLNGAQLLMEMPLDKTSLRIASMIQNSSFRMNGLIENMLDFAMGRMGNGITLNRRIEENPAAGLQSVINELRSVWPGREIHLDVSGLHQSDIDSRRIAQLLSNLVGNALAYGDKEKPVLVTASNEGDFLLAVRNYGAPIRKEALPRLFQPFSRGDLEGNKNGLGLGLYISSLIANAHGGTLTVESNDSFTEFTLRIPAA